MYVFITTDCSQSKPSQVNLQVEHPPATNLSFGSTDLYAGKENSPAVFVLALAKQMQQHFYTGEGNNNGNSSNKCLACGHTMELLAAR